MSSEGSDIELQSALPKKSNKKMPPSPSDGMLNTKPEKKLTTKIMINQALMDLNSRKGVSLYAIKKYIQEKYNVDTEKLNFHMKKYLKKAVEEGKIVQMKGIGASGSFKLVPIKEKKPKPKKMLKEKEKKPKDPEKKKKSKEMSKTADAAEKVTKKKPVKPKESKEKSTKTAKPVKKMEKDTENKPFKGKKNGEEKVKKVRIAKGMQTPSKKKSMMRRKSIGSIIKPPKMKPSKSAKA
ncbi:histone H1.1, embryonic-like [Helicoverpa armigera]|uniref:histone H1.1, embryonic-like n=1 Tax=Helicoverpa armigera TaxID=29058 RepID=UPI0030829758